MPNERGAATVVRAGIDEDNWEKTTNREANADCPNNNPFVMLPSVINGQVTKTKWWTNYWWGMNQWGKGTYVWGDGQFDSCFDPKKFYEAPTTPDGLKLKAFYDTDRINPDDKNNYPSWVTSEIVLGGLDQNDYNRPGFGHYAVILKCADFAALDPGVVLGVFTYQYGPAANSEDGYTCQNLHREIDMLETISQSQQGLPGNAQFALQPASPSPQPSGTSLWRFAIPTGTPVITLYMSWGDPMGLSGVHTKIFAGDYSIDKILSTKPEPLKGGSWDVGFTPEMNGYAWRKNIPRAKNQRLHINFYVPGGNSKGSADKNKTHEVYVKRFEFKNL